MYPSVYWIWFLYLIVWQAYNGKLAVNSRANTSIVLLILIFSLHNSIICVLHAHQYEDLNWQIISHLTNTIPSCSSHNAFHRPDSRCPSVFVQVMPFLYFLCQEQEAALRSTPDIVVATPGRMLDHLCNSIGVHLDDLAVLILDEADRLLEIGFSAEIRELVCSGLL